MNLGAQLREEPALDASEPKVALVILVLVALVALWFWWLFLKRKRLIQDVPTSAAKGVALGLNELIGTVVADQTEQSPQAGLDCVWWRNTFYEKDSDKGWEKKGEKVGGPISFLLHDDSGAIRVHPRRAEVVAPEVYDGPHVSGVLRDPDASLVSRYIAQRVDGTKRRKVVEHVIRADDPVYVLGTAQLPYESLEPHIGADREGGAPFLVRVGTEQEALFAQRVGTVVGGMISVVAGAGAGVAWADGQEIHAELVPWTEIDPVAPLVFAAVIVAAMAAISLVFVYNGLIRLRHRAQAAWGLIDVQLRRRHDLIPNLVEVVKAHADHERGVQTSIAELRSQLAHDLPSAPSDDAVRTADAEIQAETAALDRLLALAEAYPALTADAAYSKLRAELVDTEDRVALAREFYNNSVLALHDRAKSVSGAVMAWIFELDLHAEFADSLGGEEKPVVDMALSHAAGTSPASGSSALPQV